jgi:hypothetical protein
VPTVARGTHTLRPSTATRTSGASTPGNGSRRGASGTPVPTSAPVVGPGAPTPMVVVTPPVSQPQVSEPVAQPVTPVVAVPQQPTATPVAKTGWSPSVAGSSNGEGSRHDDGVTASPVADEHAAAKAARQEAKAVREEAKAARKADKHGHAPAAVVTQPVQDTATTVTDTTTTSDDAESGATDGEQGTGHRHGNGGGHNHDGGDGHGSHGRWSGEESDG